MVDTGKYGAKAGEATGDELLVDWGYRGPKEIRRELYAVVMRRNGGVR